MNAANIGSSMRICRRSDQACSSPLWISLPRVVRVLMSQTSFAAGAKDVAGVDRPAEGERGDGVEQQPTECAVCPERPASERRVQCLHAERGGQELGERLEGMRE